MGYAYPIDSKVVTNPNGTIDYDRASSSAQLRGLIKSMITNGVNMTESTNLQVIANGTNNTLTVKAGYVIIEGAIKHFENDLTVTLPTADVNNSRIDTVVARLNLNESVRDIVIDVVSGTAAATPEEPELTRNTNVYEIGLANVLVGAGATVISQSDVTDTRLLNSRCGLATSIGKIDTETLFTQLTTDFNAWFDNIKDQISEDAAGNLQLQINEHRNLSVLSEDGIHGLRYLDKSFWMFNVETQEWEKAAGGLPPRPVTSVSAKTVVYPDGSNKLIAEWSAPNVYDVQIAQYNIYGYSGDASPTSIEQFNLITSVNSNITTYEASASDAYKYILIASVSTDGIIQEDISYKCSVGTITLPSIGTSFSSMSWSNINNVLKYSDPQSYFNVGDAKSISINGTSYNIKIYDFNHDDLADGSGKAKMTLGLANCLSTYYAMNSSNTNVGGWGSCALRTTLQDTIFNQLPSELRALIKKVKKKTSAGNQSSTINTTEDTLFLFSEVELFGSTTYSKSGEGKQYPIFTNNSSRIKKQGDSGSAYNWWERSPNASNSTYFCYVNADGSANYYTASHTYGVCFGFCI